MRGLALSVMLVTCVASSSYCIPPPPSAGQEEPVGELEVARGIIALAIEDREPVDAGEVFPPDVGQLYCFVEVRGAVGETEIVHVWYWKDKEMARVELPVRSARWRTWSSKRILEDWIGPWRVDILDSEGTVLQSASFEVSGA